MTWEQFIKYLTESDGSGGRVLKVSDTINDNSDIYTSSDPSGGRVIKVTMVGGGASSIVAPFTPVDTPIVVGDTYQEAFEAAQGQITQLKNNEYKITYFESVSAATGSVTKPTGSTILTDQFAGGVDAYVSTIVNGQPTGIFPVTAGGVVIDVTSFDTAGAYVLSGTPSAYPVAIIYKIKISAGNYGNLTIANIIDLETIKINGSGTANEITYWVNSATVGSLSTATYPSLTELSYGKGVTSAIQTQINTKAPIANATFTGTFAVAAGAIANAALANSAVANLSGTNTGDETAARIGALINGSSAATPNDADLVATAESSVLKKITWTNVKTFLKTYFDAIYQAILTAANVHTFVDSLTAMTTPVDADRMIIVDNSASLDKKITWANIKATLKSYFDAIYATLASPTFTGTVTTPAIIVSSETASTVAILDASKNIKSADTTTYPSLTELAYLKGVTSALQTQLAKMPKNYAFSAGYSATLSAGTDEVAFSILIPAGTAITNDSINFYQSHSVNNSVNTKSVCVYLSTANETVGAAISGSGTKIATISGLTGAAVVTSALVRHF